MSWQSLLTVLPTAVSAGFFATTHLIFAAAMARKSPAEIPSPAPRVSVLKPVAGRDEELLQNLASFVSLDYPDYELLLARIPRSPSSSISPARRWPIKRSSSSPPRR